MSASLLELLYVWLQGFAIALLVLGAVSALIWSARGDDRPEAAQELIAIWLTASVLWPIAALAVPVLVIRYVALGWHSLLRRHRASRAARIPKARVVP